MSSFFGALALWQKMTLVLASAMAFTITLGCCKLLHNRWNLRQYAQAHPLATTDTNDLGTVTAETPFKVDMEANRDSKIPFGVRALESGIEVDGVWISPNSSPRSSRQSSPASARDKTKFASTFSQSSLLKNEVGDDATMVGSPSWTTLTSTACETPISAERLASTSSLYSIQSTSTEIKSARPERHLRGRSLPRDLSFLDVDPFPISLLRELPDTVPRSPPYPSRRHNRSDLGRVNMESTSDDITDAVREPVTGKRQKGRPEISRSYVWDSGSDRVEISEDIYLAAMHRLNQAASTGQLARKATFTASPNQAETDGEAVISVANEDPSRVAESKTSLVYDASDSHVGKVQRTEKLRTDQIPQHDDLVATWRSKKQSTDRLNIDAKYTLSALRNFRIHRHPEVQMLRTVNTGFAVLKPGTVRPIPQVAEEVFLHDVEANSIASRPRKLQKKQREHSLRDKFKIFRRSSSRSERGQWGDDA